MRHIFLLEDAHVARDTDEDVLRDVDLHQDEELVEGAENVANGTQVDPFSSVHAKQVLHRIGVGLFVQDEVSSSDCENRDDSEDKVANKEALSLLLEKHFVVSQFVA